MDLLSVFPIILPGAIMQVLIQATFISHCWRSNTMTKRAKAWTIAAIAVFNTPAAAAYLFLSRPKDIIQLNDYEDPETDSNIKQGTFVLLTVAFELFSLRIVAIGDLSSKDPRIAWLLSVCFLAFILLGLINNKRYPKAAILLPPIQIVLVMAVVYLDGSQESRFLVLIVMAGIINACSLKLGRLHAVLAFSAYLSVSILRILMTTMTGDEIISMMYIDMLVFVMVYMAFYMLKKQLIANKMLKEQALKLEEMATLQERNRITGEIHDTVGHTLTSAAIAIEAGEKLMGKDMHAAMEKLALAREQVRKGLYDIRQSVKTIQAEGEKDFLLRLSSLTEDIEQRTGLHISVVTELNTSLLPIQQNVLLHAVMECATNSLKHGHAGSADLLIQEYKSTAAMTFSDNGAGTEEIKYGFGLDNMRRQAESIGGALRAESASDEGFTVSVTIPIGKTTGGEKA